MTDCSFLDVFTDEKINDAPDSLQCDPESFLCDICSKTFKEKKSLRRHMKSHDSSIKYKCTSCTQYFKSEDDFQKHRNDRHSKTHLCSFCGMMFKKKHSLDEHITLYGHNGKSDGTGVYICPFENCRKRYTRLIKYEGHLNRHTNTKPYSCKICSKTFSETYRKNDHEKICSGVMKIKCDVCLMSFRDKSALSRHVESQHLNKTFACGCGKIFKYYSSLCKHKKSAGHENF